MPNRNQNQDQDQPEISKQPRGGIGGKAEDIADEEEGREESANVGQGDEAEEEMDAGDKSGIDRDRGLEEPGDDEAENPERTR